VADSVVPNTTAGTARLTGTGANQYSFRSPCHSTGCTSTLGSPTSSTWMQVWRRRNRLWRSTTALRPTPGGRGQRTIASTTGH